MRKSTIAGDGFSPGKTQAEVRFGHKKSEVVTIASTTKIKAVTPPGEKGPVDITVSFDDGPCVQDREWISLRRTCREQQCSQRFLRWKQARLRQDRDREEVVLRGPCAEPALQLPSLSCCGSAQRAPGLAVFRAKELLAHQGESAGRQFSFTANAQECSIRGTHVGQIHASVPEGNAGVSA